MNTKQSASLQENIRVRNQTLISLHQGREKKGLNPGDLELLDR